MHLISILMKLYFITSTNENTLYINTLIIVCTFVANVDVDGRATIALA